MQLCVLNVFWFELTASLTISWGPFFSPQKKKNENEDEVIDDRED